LLNKRFIAIILEIKKSNPSFKNSPYQSERYQSGLRGTGERERRGEHVIVRGEGDKRAIEAKAEA
jgi:hypothetical protein